MGGDVSLLDAGRIPWATKGLGPPVPSRRCPFPTQGTRAEEQTEEKGSLRREGLRVPPFAAGGSAT